MALLSLQHQPFPPNFPSSRSNTQTLSFLPVRTPKQLKARCRCFSTASQSSREGFLVVEDDLPALLQILPRELQVQLENEPRQAELLEVVMDLGRRPEARFLGEPGGQYLRNTEVSQEELQEAERVIGEFGGDNRAGIEGTLHRISAIRSRKGTIVGLTCRVGRAVTGHVDMVRDLLEYKESILFLGRYGNVINLIILEVAQSSLEMPVLNAMVLHGLSPT